MASSASPDPARLTALIADDEEAPRAQLRAALARAWPELDIVAECPNGVEAWDAWLAHEPDLCFLDIRMPGLDGIDVARRIDGRTPVVFVTAHDDHALAAFDAGAADYVLKPVDPARLAQALARVRGRVGRRRAAAAASAAGADGAAQGAVDAVDAGATGPDTAALHALLARLQALGAGGRPAPRLQVIQAAVGKEVRMIPVAEVVYFEADARYTRVVYGGSGALPAGEALIRTPLKELLAQLDEAQFWQVHRSVIVHQAHIAAAVRVDEGQMHLVLRGRPERLPVSRPFQGLFRGQ
jgi:DNA-binding LytR/AlgR family response regulator